MKHINCILLFLFIYLILALGYSTAQVTYHSKQKPTAEEKSMDERIRSCTQDQLGQHFEFSEWTARLHFHTRKMIQRLSAEYVSAIAAQKETVFTLHQLAAQCPELTEVQSEIESIYKIYDKHIIYETASTSTGLFDDEEVHAKMDKGDAEDLLKKLDKIQKKLNITRYITRIQ